MTQTAQQFPKILTAFESIPDGRSLKSYLAHGGYEAFKKALTMAPDAIAGEVKAAGLRGRGGAGFPTGVKWGFIPKTHTGPRYLICNNDEGEPGTFKDRVICEQCPHMLIEGMLIAARAIGAKRGYIYTRGEFYNESAWLEAAIDEAYAAGWLGKNIQGSGMDFDLENAHGAGAYICGEESALLSSLEGKKGYPKLKPPFPAVSGYLKSPTIINNTETLAAVPWIITHGSAAYKAIGTEKSPGTKLFGVSGPVVRPGIYERPLGYSLEKLIFEDAGGLLPGLKLKGVIPGGLSAAVLLPEEIKGLTLDYEALAAKGTMLGSGGVIVIPDTQCVTELLRTTVNFFAHESCGQCTPCREGTGWLANIMNGVWHGEGTPEDVDLMQRVAGRMGGRTICALSEACSGPTIAFTKKFGDEIRAFIARQSRRA